MNPNVAEAWNSLGVAHARHGQLEEAMRRYREAIRLKPNLSSAWDNLGRAGAARPTRRGDPPLYASCAAQARFSRSSHQPGQGLMRQGQFDAAMGCFDEALRDQPGFALGHWNRSLVLLLLRGDFAQGWPEYEWRWAEHPASQPQFPPTALGRLRLWTGRTILLYAEQGLGDAIQFIRYAHWSKQRGGTVIVECHAPLVGLLAGASGIDDGVSSPRRAAAFRRASAAAQPSGHIQDRLDQLSPRRCLTLMSTPNWSRPGVRNCAHRAACFRWASPGRATRLFLVIASVPLH